MQPKEADLHHTLAILISASTLRDGEVSIVSDLFEIGLQRFHLRKPDSTASEVAAIIEKIPSCYHHRIVVHRFPELLKHYELGGYHHYSSEPIVNCSGTASRSIHSLEDLKHLDASLDYCFWGPIYESISKKGHSPKFPLPEIAAALYERKKKKGKKPLIYALGGVRRRKIPELFNLGFDGITLLGSIWGKKDPVAAFEKYQFIERSVWAKREKEKGLFQRILSTEDK